MLAAVGMAIFAGGGKKRSASDQGRTQVRSVVEASKAAASAQPAAGAKPALPAAAVEPAKPQPAAEAKPQAQPDTKPAAAETIARPAEKPAQPEKPAPAPAPAAEATKPAEKGVAEKPVPAQHLAAQKPAGVPKPAGERQVVDKAKPSSEPALARPEKKQGPAAMSGAKPDGDKALWATQAYQRGNAKLLGGAPTEAIAAFSEALRLNPKDVQSRRGLGLAYAQSGNAGQAVHHLKLYLKASPNAPDRALIQKRIDQLGGH